MKAPINMGYNYNSLHSSFDFAYKSITKLENWNIFHIHEGMEFIYVHEGSGFAIIDQKIYEIGPRTLIYFQPYQLHGTRVYIDSSSVYARSILSFEPSELNSYLQSFPSLKTFFHMIWKTKLHTQIISHLPENNPIENMFSQYHLTLSNCHQKELTEEYVLFIIGFLKYVKTIWPQQEQHKNESPSTSPTYIEKIMEWIEKNYTKEFHLKSLSDELHLSQHYVAHLFHNSTGTNITEYVIARRIRQACWLLKNSSLSISEVCHHIGLTNVSYFCKKFKEYTGRTPLKYRKD
jgi:AraC-like DNA-binding protein